LIYEAHETTTTQNATDDCQLVLAKGCPVKIVQGSEENMKITTEWDLKIAQFLYQKQHYIF
jgi:2-C-methyl-D-erythritol 4-phosphate cytidylyltransferase